jgi:hypothetical protein
MTSMKYQSLAEILSETVEKLEERIVILENPYWCMQCDQRFSEEWDYDDHFKFSECHTQEEQDEKEQKERKKKKKKGYWKYGS